MQSQSHLCFYLIQFKKGMFAARMEHHTAPTESVYLEWLTAWQLDLSSSLTSLHYLKGFESKQVLGG